MINFLVYEPDKYSFLNYSDSKLKAAISLMHQKTERVALLIISSDPSLKGLHCCDSITHQPVNRHFVNHVCISISKDYVVVGAIVSNNSECQNAINQLSMLLKAREMGINLLILQGHGNKRLISFAKPDLFFGLYGYLPQLPQFLNRLSYDQRKTMERLFQDLSNAKDKDGLKQFINMLQRLCESTSTWPIDTDLTPEILKTLDSDMKRIKGNIVQLREDEDIEALSEDVEEDSDDEEEDSTSLSIKNMQCDRDKWVECFNQIDPKAYIVLDACDVGKMNGIAQVLSGIAGGRIVIANSSATINVEYHPVPDSTALPFSFCCYRITSNLIDLMIEYEEEGKDLMSLSDFALMKKLDSLLAEEEEEEIDPDFTPDDPRLLELTDNLMVYKKFRKTHIDHPIFARIIDVFLRKNFCTNYYINGKLCASIVPDVNSFTRLCFDEAILSLETTLKRQVLFHKLPSKL